MALPFVGKNDTKNEKKLVPHKKGKNQNQKK
jgi:hypothetical protein